MGEFTGVGGIELAVTRAQRACEAAGEPKAVIRQSYWGKKFKLDKLTRGDVRGINSWRYVALARMQTPVGRESHDSTYTDGLCEAVGINKVDLPPNSSGFNPSSRFGIS